MKQDSGDESDSTELFDLAGLDQLHLKGTPTQRFASPGREPEMLRLALKFKGETYEAIMAGTIGGARELGVGPDYEEWMQENEGWWVSVAGQRGRFFSAPYPTAEAAVVAAILLPRQISERRRSADEGDEFRSRN